MEILTTTPFGPRRMSAELLKQEKVATAPAPLPQSDKWGMFRELCTARTAFDLSDRDLTVLSALLSFHPGNDLEDGGALIVFPSNAALSQRAHGMAESTLRRHLAALVRAGVIRRHDSPNGKRYAARGADGVIARAFGFDLRPLLVRAEEIARAAQALRETQERKRRLREEITLLKRDAIKLLEYGMETVSGPDWESLRATLLDLHRRSRHRVDAEVFRALRDELRLFLSDLRSLFSDETVSDSENMSGNDSDSGRHYQNSKPDSHCLEPCKEKARATGGVPPSRTVEPKLPLMLVVKACPDILDYAEDGIRGWSDLCHAADFVRGMMGVSPDAWREAVREMGHPTAAIVLVCILQRIQHIRSPGGYLRSLTRKAADGAFSPGPMVMALLAPDRRAVDSCQQEAVP